MAAAAKTVQQMSSNPQISAAVCTYNRYDLLEASLSGLRRQTLPADSYQILVIDNSPDSARAHAYRQKYDGVDNIRYIHTPTPGLANARNVAARECRSAFIAYIDDDAVAESDWLQNLLAAFAKFGDKAGGAGGPVLPVWEEPQPSWLAGQLLDCLSVIDWGGRLRIAAENEWAAGANMAFRTKALIDAGGFPVGLGRNGAGEALLSNEELVLQSKLRAGGYDMIWAPAAKVRHLIGKERLQQGWLRRRLAWQAVSDLLAGKGGEKSELPAHWQRLVDFMNALPPRLRTPRGLFAEMKAPEDFASQAYATYTLTMLLLLGHHIPEEGPGANDARDLRPPRPL